MILQVAIERLRTLDEVRDFMASSAPVDFRFVERPTRTPSCDGSSGAFPVLVAAAVGQGLVQRFLIKVTGFSRARTTRLITQYPETGRIEDRRRSPKRPLPSRCTKEDIRLLAPPLCQRWFRGQHQCRSPNSGRECPALQRKTGLAKF